MAASGIGVVWLKRDLRIADHAALSAAAASGLPLVLLYLYEPALLAAVHFGRCHLDFINESLQELDASLQRLSSGASAGSGSDGSSSAQASADAASSGCAALTIRHADAVDALAALHTEFAPAGGISKMWSHEETGTPAVTARNAAVREWVQREGVDWTELPQTGVTRNLASRDGWAKRWTKLMEAPMLPAPAQLRLAGDVDDGRLMGAQELGVEGEPKPEAMKGGESRAQALLDSFLGGRAAGYSKNMSSPVTAWEGCSRLSAYLAWGCISLRTVHQRTKAAADVLRAAKGKAGKGAGGGGGGASAAQKRRQRRGRNAAGSDDEPEDEVEDGDVEADEEVEAGAGDEAGEGEHHAGEAAQQSAGAPAAAPGSAAGSGGAQPGLKDLAAFTARLRWRSHFMQKLEDQQDLVSRNMCSAYDGARNEEAPDAERLAAWCEGRTGYPMVDAVVRCLLRSGWINFRMRAMIFSFAAYHLWIHWRFTADFMAAHFIDYEPGIHYPQAQMQAGTTGINTFRVYSPSKQVADHDPKGVFIKKYVPELANLPDKYLAEPWRMPAAVQAQCGCVIGKDYPAPIVQPDAGRQNCRQLYAIKASLKAKEEAQQVYKKHGSRKKPGRPGGRAGGSSGGGAAGRAGRGRATPANTSSEAPSSGGGTAQPAAAAGRGRKRKAAES
ncbi:hypothetical protein ABPG75_007764 [Micractinium tetrahymenae]